MDVKRVIYGLDELNAQGRSAEAEQYLERWYEDALAEGDDKSALSILSEMLGQYRKNGSAEKGLDCVEKTLAALDGMGISETATGATILINAATTLTAFGKAAEAMPVFEKCERIFREKLEDGDYRLSALYNNMATACESLGMTDTAEDYYFRALEAIKPIENSGNDRAVTWCNLAGLYERSGREEKDIFSCMENAYSCLCETSLPHDSYHSFTLSKCIPAFDYYGFFLYAGELRKRKASIDELFG